MIIAKKTKAELEGIELAKSKIRKVTEEDKKTLPTVSYSKLDNFNNCPLGFKFKYIDKNYSDVSTLALEIGTATHYGLELKAKNILNGETPNIESIIEIVKKGIGEQEEVVDIIPSEDEEKAVKTTPHDDSFVGVDSIKRRYFELWNETCEKSNMDYNEKMDLYFNEVLVNRLEDKDWEIVGVEMSFEYVYDDRVIIHGFIDRVDRLKSNPDIYRIVDYKSSKKVFIDQKIKTPLQHVIYDLACLLEFEVVPEIHEYDFILLNRIQGSADGVCSKGYLKRGIAKIDSTLDAMDEFAKSGEYRPKPTPLCYWCAFHSDSPNNDPLFSGMCQYHSLWTPNEKTFATLNPYGEVKETPYDYLKPPTNNSASPIKKEIRKLSW